MHVDLTGKTAILTGASSGVGLATALQFVESGLTNLVAVDKDRPPPELQRLLDAEPNRLLFVQGSVAEEDTARRFATLALDGTLRQDRRARQQRRRRAGEGHPRTYARRVGLRDEHERQGAVLFGSARRPGDDETALGDDPQHRVDLRACGRPIA
jgi:NAD(P)-dependent dehydrogenase (short-subunit alcohol dehydrogenase family)